MTWPSRLTARGAPWLVGCVAALSLHALLFSFLQLRGSRPRGPGLSRSRDNTPELLQFSSQPAPTVSVDALPLPKSRLLPPPPELLPPLRPAQAATGATGPQGRSARRGQRPEVSSINPAGLSPRAGLAQQGDQGRRFASGATPTATTGPDNQADWAMAAEHLRRFVRQDPAAASFKASVDSTAAQDGQAPVRMALDPPLQQAYQTLWQRARPLAPQPLGRESSDLTSAVEVRQASLRQVRAAAVSIRHGEFVVLPDDVQLFWLLGDHLFILQSPRNPSRLLN